jgi:hypothetical protein
MPDAKQLKHFLTFETYINGSRGARYSRPSRAEW